MKKALSHNNDLKEIRELFSEIYSSEKTNGELRFFARKTRKRYKDNLQKMLFILKSMDINRIQVLPKKLPCLPKRFDVLMAVLAFVTPIGLTILFYTIQFELFFATLISITATPICYIVFYVSVGVTLRKQTEIIDTIASIIKY